ncbi:MAG: phosphoglucosamine mutase [Clostridia bacterium]|nr:phosphoglucosamine mutase [Clostridia bacterium]
MGEFFGTDGVRGIANEELTPELAYKLGRAGAYVLAKDRPSAKIVIGKDTRISGDMLEAALVAGITSVGVDVLKVGVIPTPAIALLTRQLGAQAGVVISASHNPVADNGIKFFAGTGYKLPDEVETEIEKYILEQEDRLPRPTGAGIGRVKKIADAQDRYVEFLKETVNVNFTGIKVVADCAQGAACQVAPRVLRELGAEVIAINHQPDGTNINEGCGSTHPEMLQQKVVKWGAHLGIAHDGDADRVIAVDSKGNLVDGDFIMVICALHLHSKGQLPKDSVVVTVMSNLGLFLALKKAGINVLETKVGDRYVMEELLKTGTTFGGEQSGHIIFLNHNTTGDGLLTALQLISVVKETGKSLDELAAQMQRLPQVLVNVRVKNKNTVMNHLRLKEAIAEAEAKLAGQGRVLVRPSGTEPIVRIMAEGPDKDDLEKLVGDMVRVVESLE